MCAGPELDLFVSAGLQRPVCVAAAGGRPCNRAAVHDLYVKSHAQRLKFPLLDH